MQTGPKGVNWIEALIFYCTSENGRFPSYQEVSKRFSVSTRTVENRAKTEGWVKIRLELGKKELQTVASTKIEQIKHAEQEHLRIWQELQSSALMALNKYHYLKDSKTQDLKNITEILKTAIAGERTVLNLPNSVSKAEVTNINPNVDSISKDQIEQIDRLMTENHEDTRLIPTM